MWFLVFVFTILLSVLIAAYINEIEDFMVKHCYLNANKIRKIFIKRERKQIKTTILNKQTSSSYIMFYIEYEENIKWLQRKGFNVTKDGTSSSKHRYEITWDSNNDTCESVNHTFKPVNHTFKPIDITEEWYQTKLAIKAANDAGRKFVEKTIIFSENIDRLKKNGFTVFEISELNFYYRITWEE